MAMDRPSAEPRPPERVGRLSQFVGTRLLMIGIFAGVLGAGFLAFTGYQVWRLVTGGSTGSNVVPMVVGGAVALALLSIGASARRTGLQYLRGQKTVARDLGRFVARRLDRRRR
jgi:hypothetical protein